MSYIAPKDQCHCQPSSGPFHSRMEAVMTCAQVYQKLDRWGKRRFYHYAVWNGTQELPHAGCHHICHQESRCLFFKSSPIWLIPTWCKKQDWQVYVCVFFCVFLFWFGFFFNPWAGGFCCLFFFLEKCGDLYTNQIPWKEQGGWKIKWKMTTVSRKIGL